MKEKTFKDIEHMLYSYKRVKAEINDIDIEISEILDNEYEGISGQHNEVHEGSPTNKISSTVESQVLSRENEVEYLRRIKRSKERYIKRIDNMITILSDNERQFITLKYFECKRHKDIVSIMSLSEDGISSKRRVVISSLVDFINKSKKHTLNTY